MGQDAPISVEEVKAIARLANLELDADEEARMARELGKILAYVRQLTEVDVSQVEPTMGGLRATSMSPLELSPAGSAPAGSPPGTRVPLRADETEVSLPPDLALREAPRAHDGGFAVPAFVDDG
jgi:aspartyl-tRNA(Asn)/glutamyl-tRNA(Gln) amidotransferase subunit C